MGEKSEKYLFGFMTSEGIIRIEEPYMIIEAADDTEARKKYCDTHDAASHDTAELIAKKSGGIWWKITKYLSHEKIASIIGKIE